VAIVNCSSNLTFSKQVIEAMSVGANFARAKDSIAQDRSVAVLTLYSFMTPVGIVLGMVLASELQGTAVLVVESVALSVASGSFVYLAFHEISDEHAAQDSTPIEKIALFGAGLFSMAALATWA
jgi:solute carrier family 39 (zinc transporter), member 1/2/3